MAHSVCVETITLEYLVTKSLFTGNLKTKKLFVIHVSMDSMMMEYMKHTAIFHVLVMGNALHKEHVTALWMVGLVINAI